MPKCYILVGVPGSGKSTYLKANIIDVETVASSDNTIEAIAEEYGFTYSEAFKDLIGFATKVFEDDLNLAIDNDFDIAIDRTNLTPKVRRRFIEKFKKAGYTVTAVVFETPDEEEWKLRLNSRPGKHIPQDVLNSMAKNFVYPTLDEGFDFIVKGDLE